MRDERRLRLIRENKIPEYLRKGWGAIYLEELGEAEISPIELVNRLAARMPESFGPWLKRVEGVTDQAIMYIVERIPAGWISPPQRELARSLIGEARDQLTRIKLL